MSEQEQSTAWYKKIDEKSSKTPLISSWPTVYLLLIVEPIEYIID